MTRGEFMKKLIEELQEITAGAFAECGYDRKYGTVVISNRPDLCEYQCNGALAAAKEYHKAPFLIAKEVGEKLTGSPAFASVEAVNPGFLNFRVSGEKLADYASGMRTAQNYGAETEEKPMTIMIDYGGPNVAKPLHVGHLRSAVIGESIKRIDRFAGNHVIGDVHLGDWGLQMGLIITELKKRKPELPYFDPEWKGDYPKEAPFTIGELEEIYPTASAYAKEHPEYAQEAHNATYELQHGNRGYQALWNHIIEVSVTDLKKNYRRLGVEFDLWKKESDAQPYIPQMIQKMKDEGFAHLDQGALVVDVKEDSDTKEVPPCMILKSDGATLYNTTDLATLVERMKLFAPDEVLYVVDKRQDLYFEQVFRCAKKTGIVPAGVKLRFLGFGTMNGKDGKPFKTREGGVMRLESLIREITDAVYEKMEDRDLPEEERRAIAEKVGVAALKYGDLSNQASKNYVFDVERFSSFEGNTGPYILYTVVRIHSILAKYRESVGKNVDLQQILPPEQEAARALLLALSRFNDVFDAAYHEDAPHRLCAFMFELANACNTFYHAVKILTEEDEKKRDSYMAMMKLSADLLECCCGLLGMEVPERM